MSGSEGRQGRVRLEVSARLDLGLYKIKFRAGSLIQEVHQEVAPGAGTIRVTGPTLRFSSAAPLETTRTTHEYHEDAARALSREVHRTLGEGSQLFLFL